MSLAFLNSHDSSEVESHSDAIWGVKWSAAHDFVLSASADGELKRWGASGQSPLPLAHHVLGIVSIDTDVAGENVLYNTLEGLTVMKEIRTAMTLGQFESYARTAAEPAEPAWSVSLSPDSQTYAATGGSGNVTIHSTSHHSFGERRSVLTSGRSKFGMFCKYSPDGTRVAMSSEAGQIYIFDVAAEKLLSTYTSHAMAVRSLAWSPDSQLLISASEDKRLILHDVRYSASGKPGLGAVATLTGHSSWVLSVDISPDARFALSGSADKTVKVWDLSARAAVSTVQDTGEVWGVSWRQRPPQNGSTGEFVTGGEAGTVRWWKSAGAN